MKGCELKIFVMGRQAMCGCGMKGCRIKNEE